MKKIKWINKIDVSKIIKMHLKTLVSQNTKKPEFGDYFTFLFLPVVISGCMVFVFEITISQGNAKLLITCFSIFIALLLNVNVLLFNIVKGDKDNNHKQRAAEQLFYNVSFGILLSISSIITIFLTFIPDQITKYIFLFVLFFLCIEFLFLLLMVIKRMFYLLENQLSEN